MTHSLKNGKARLLLVFHALAASWAAIGPAACEEADHAKIMEEMRKSEEHRDAWERYPIAGIPVVQTPPQVDGVVEAREWFAAAMLNGLVDYQQGLATRDQATLYLCYTSTHLYIAYQFERPETARSPAANDFFEILIDAWHQHRRYYNVAVNLEKVAWDGIGPNVDKNAWNPEWAYKARLTELGWEGEMAVAFKDFGLDGPPTAGTVWGIDFVRNEKTPMDRLAVWSFRGKNWHAVKNLGHVFFTGKALAVRAEGIGWIRHSRQAGAKILVANFSERPETLEVSMELRKAPQAVALGYHPTLESVMAEQMPAAIGSPLKNEIANALKNFPVLKQLKESVTVESNTNRMVSLAESDIPGDYLVLYSIRSGSQQLAGGLVPFRIDVPLAIKLERHLLSARTLAYTIDLRRITEAVKGESPALAVAVSVADSSGKVVAQGRSPANQGQQEVAGTLTFEPRWDSTYVFTAVLADGEKELARNQEPIRIPPRPAWVDNTLGKKKFVPEPWVAVKASARQCDVLSSQFTWAKSSLLPQFRVFGKEILADPPRMVFKDKDGKECIIKISRFRVREKDEEKATCELKAQCGKAATITATITIEFDGFVWYDMTVSPKETIDLSEVSILFPLKKEFAGFCTAADNLYSGAVPESGKQFPFIFAVWMGGLEAGVQWCAENNRNWHNKDPKKAIEVIPSADRSALAIHLIDKPVTLRQPTEWSFGFIPTPSRVKPREWGKYGFFQTGGIALPPKEPPTEDIQKSDPNRYFKHKSSWDYYTGDRWKRDRELIYGFIFHGYWQELFGYPGTHQAEKQKLLKESVQWLHGLDIKVIVYAGWGVNTEAPEWADFGLEMVRLPLYNSGYSTFRQCPTTLWQDWFIFKMAEMIREYDIDGIFIDSVTSPILTENYTEGMRWLDDSGKVRGSYPVRATREWLKRLYKLWHGELKPSGVVYNHNSPPAVMPIESFEDVRTPSEYAQHHEGQLDKEFLNFYIAKNGGEQYGLFVEHTCKDWMGEWARKKTNQVYAVAIPLNVSIKAVSLYAPYLTKNSYALDAQPMPWIWAANRWIDRSTAEYLPWWRNSALIRTEPSDDHVLTALWLRKGEKALVCVSNLLNKPRRIEVKFSLEKMGFNTISVEDALTGEVITSDGGHISLDIDFERYRLLKVFGVTN